MTARIVAVIVSVILCAGFWGCPVLPSPTPVSYIQEDKRCSKDAKCSRFIYKKSSNETKQQQTERPQADKVVIFIHGVFGDPDETWTQTQKNVYWPQLLADDPVFSDYDVYVVGYESPFFSRFSSNINEIATRVLHQLEEDIFKKGYKQIHLITHSMGGLIAKRVLVMLNRPDQVKKLRRVRSVLFFSTPSQGAGITNFAQIFSENPQIKDMQPADFNTFLQSLEDDWHALLQARDKSQAQYPRAYCAYEKEETNGTVIVSRRESASRCDQDPYAINSNHIQIVKPADRTADSYIWARDRIMEAAGMRAPAWQRVVIMDAHHVNLVYDKMDYQQGRTNADAIIDSLNGLEIVTVKELTNPSWSGDQRVVALDPDLIIIHLSCFYQETNPNDSDGRFRTFIKDMFKKTEAKFLVYSRSFESSESDHQTEKRWSEQMKFLNQEDFRKRIVFMAIPKERARFNDITTRSELRERVEKLLGLQE